jgi:hypothetical protein
MGNNLIQSGIARRASYRNLIVRRSWEEGCALESTPESGKGILFKKAERAGV